MRTATKLVTVLSAPSYLQRLVAIGGPNLINVLPLNDAVAGGTALDPVTGRNWTYGASNVSSGPGLFGQSAAVFGGAAAGQVVPTAGTLTALNAPGAFNPLEGTLMAWVNVSAANMASATQYALATVGAALNNRIFVYKISANTLAFQYNIGSDNVSRTVTYNGGTWAHGALTWSNSGNFRSSYFNGVPLAAHPYAGIYAGLLSANWTQLASINNSSYLSGSIQHWSILNRPLTAAEIAALARTAL